MECPANFLVVALGGGLADVVQHGGPAKPQVVAFCSYMVKHFEGVVEVVFVAALPNGFHSFEVAEFGEDDGHEACFLQQFETDGGSGGEDDFVEFGGDALGRHDFDALGVALDGVEGGVLYAESQLCGKADGTHHAQRVVAEGYVGVERGADDALVEVVNAVERVEELPECINVQ